MTFQEISNRGNSVLRTNYFTEFDLDDAKIIFDDLLHVSITRIVCDDEEDNIKNQNIQLYISAGEVGQKTIVKKKVLALENRTKYSYLHKSKRTTVGRNPDRYKCKRIIIVWDDSMPDAVLPTFLKTGRNRVIGKKWFPEMRVDSNSLKEIDN